MIQSQRIPRFACSFLALLTFHVNVWTVLVVQAAPQSVPVLEQLVIWM